MSRNEKILPAATGAPLAKTQAAGVSAEDGELAARLAQGDEEAFRTLVQRYHGALLRLALAFVAERTAAEEVVQDTWLGVMNGIRGFEGRASLKSWIFRILTNRAKTRGVRDKRFIPFSSLGNPGRIPEEPAVEPSRFNSSGGWADPPSSWQADNPEEVLMRQETGAALEKAIAELPPVQRSVITLRDVEGFDAFEVCNILEISETNQRVLLHRARSKIRRALEQHLTGKQT
jgi:RNA polymerase sigma-70 factor, ECF subfamily